MTPLALIWWASVVMVFVALAWMLILVLARLQRERSGQTRELDRERLRAACLSIVSGSGEAAACLGPFRHRARLLAEGLLEFDAIVRGLERDRLIAAYRQVGADGLLRARLFIGSRAGRLAAVEALALFPSDETVEALNRVIDRSQKAGLTVAAIGALVDMNRPPPLGRVLDDLKGGGLTDSLAYIPVVRRLVALSPDDALRRLDAPGTDPAARALLADFVAATGDYRAVAPLERAAQSESADVRTAAVRGLGLLAHPASVPALTHALSDPEWEVRAAACDAVARTGAAGVVEDLVLRLCDGVWWVRFQAAGALTRLGPEGLAALVSASRSADDVSRRAAAMALAEKGLIDPAPEGCAA